MHKTGTHTVGSVSSVLTLHTCAEHIFPNRIKIKFELADIHFCRESPQICRRHDNSLCLVVWEETILAKLVEQCWLRLVNGSWFTSTKEPFKRKLEQRWARLLRQVQHKSSKSPHWQPRLPWSFDEPFAFSSSCSFVGQSLSAVRMTSTNGGLSTSSSGVHNHGVETHSKWTNWTAKK